MDIERLKKDLDGKMMKIVGYDLKTGDDSYEDAPIADGVDFLFNYLLPAHREIGNRNKKATIIWNGKVVMFDRHKEIGENERWKLTIGMHMDEQIRDKVARRIAAAYKIWVGRGVAINVMWHPTERGGCVLYIDFPERMSGLV